jgi:hypothetical protein
LTGDVDKQWMKAWLAVKKNDPRIYDANYKFFEGILRILFFFFKEILTSGERETL